jgi:hypothetical protein
VQPRSKRTPYRKFQLNPHETFLTAVEIGIGLALWLWADWRLIGGLLIGAAIGAAARKRALALAMIEELRW